VANTFHHPPDESPVASSSCFDDKSGASISSYATRRATDTNRTFKACYKNMNSGVNPNEYSSILNCLAPRLRNGRRALFLVGDSHAADLVGGVARVAESADFALGFVAYAGCGYYSPHWVAYQHQMIVQGIRQQGECTWVPYLTRAFEELLRPGDIVLVSHIRPRATDQHATEFYEETVLPLMRAKQATLVVLGDRPEMPISSLEACYNTRWSSTKVEKCQKPRNFVYTHSGYSSGKARGTFKADDDTFAPWAARNAPHVRFLATWTLWCTDTTCGPEVPGTSSFGYHDLGHLNAVGDIYLWPFLCSALSDWGLL